ncbi:MULTISPECIES: serpin family protein [Myxococcus]|uniref:serpin family protein n=1 Tax=Myxococcus TaxID=32 RepID=UPI001142FDD2|nr:MULTISPECIES: serpin family protein [Myxococcus]NOK01290.1 serpin family protein [Myxococcus xanthus]
MAVPRIQVVACCTAALLLAGCESTPCSSAPPSAATRCLPPELEQAPGEYITSSAPRHSTPTAADEELAAFVSGNTSLGVALYQRAIQEKQNVFFSPYSVTQALSTVYAGARGNTAAQMAQALRFSLSQSRHHPTANALERALAKPPSHPPASGTPPTFHSLNSAWGQQGMTFHDDFLDTLARHYGAGMHLMDFENDAAGARAEINRWVEVNTKDRIQDLVDEESLPDATRLMLINAVYFKGAWSWPFNEQGTRNAAFRALDGTSHQVPTMSGGMGQYMEGDGFEAVTLDYAGGTFRMVLILPEWERFEEVESRLSPAFFDEVRARLENRRLDIRLPRFQIESELPLIPALQALGMEDAFTASADFSAISPTKLMIATVNHKAFVAVNEIGTEAAAATAVGMVPVSLPEPFHVNRPFIFVIEHVATQNVLFLGRFVKP